MKKIVQINIKAGDLTFSQRIKLGKIIASNDSEIDKFVKVFECLHNYKPAEKNYKKLIDYFELIIHGLEHWINLESTLLKYEPTPEEKRAGVKQLSEKIGEFGTIKALAKAYNKDPDEVLEWKYGKVFGILYTDLEEYKFQLRYNKEIEKKHKT